MLDHDLDASQTSVPAKARMEQRTTVEAKALIENAARMLGLSASDFTVAAACKAARETLDRYNTTRLSAAEHAAFTRAFETTEPTPALVDLMRLHKDVAQGT